MKLSADERSRLKSGDFAMPKDRTYPMHTVEHARDSLSRVDQAGTPDEKSKVRAAVYKRHPKLAAEKLDVDPNDQPAKKFVKPDPSALGSG